jgi:hypothetical protein
MLTSGGGDAERSWPVAISPVAGRGSSAADDAAEAQRWRRVLRGVRWREWDGRVLGKQRFFSKAFREPSRFALASVSVVSFPVLPCCVSFASVSHRRHARDWCVDLVLMVTVSFFFT